MTSFAVILLLAVYSLLTNPLLLIALAFLIGVRPAVLVSLKGPLPPQLLPLETVLSSTWLTPLSLSLLPSPLFLTGVQGYVGINRFIPEPVQFGSTTVEPKHLYMLLFIVGIPILWISAPIASFFWLVGSSSVLILGHAALLEPGVESEYGTVQGV